MTDGNFPGFESLSKWHADQRKREQFQKSLEEEVSQDG